MGNTNFSIMLPRLLFTRAHGAELVARAIRERLGISGCGVNKRNDVVIRDGEKEYKVSLAYITPIRFSQGEYTGFRISLQDHPASSLSSRDNAYLIISRRAWQVT